jgi:tetratricopeptide (TPR) repeat protein
MIAKNSIWLTNAEAYFERSLSYSGIKQYEKAIDDCDKTIAINPNHIRAYGLKGGTLQLLGHKQKAIDAFRQCLRIGDNPVVVAIAKKALIELGIPAETSTITNRAPMSAEEYLKNGMDNMKSGQYEQAVENYNKAITTSTNDTTTAISYFGRGYVYYQLKRYEQALADFDKAIAAKNNDAMTYNFRAKTYMELKQYNEAINDFYQAATLDPSRAVTYYINAAFAHLFLKQYEEAVTDFDKIIALDPQQEDVYYYKAKTLMENLKRPQEAIDAFHQYLQHGTKPAWIADAKTQLNKLGVEP